MRFEGRRAPSNACGIGGGQPGNGDPLAPRRLPSLLALTIKASRWPSEDATRDPTTHSRYEHREPAPPCLGERTCQVRLPPSPGLEVRSDRKGSCCGTLFPTDFCPWCRRPVATRLRSPVHGPIKPSDRPRANVLHLPLANPSAGSPRPTRRRRSCLTPDTLSSSTRTNG